MNTLLWLQASADLGDAFRRHAGRSSSLSGNWFLIVLVAGIGLLWLGLYYWDKYRKLKDEEGSDPASAFSDLCGVHQLSRMERSLLRNVASSKKLEQPAIVFVDPEILSAFTRTNSTKGQAYAALEKKLFGSKELG